MVVPSNFETDCRAPESVIDCPNCETPLDEGLDVCPYCEEPIEPSKPIGRGVTQEVVTVNLKKGNPTSQFALDRLDVALASQRARGTGVLRLIHGYGSKGLGGIIRNVVRERLEHLRYNREIRGFIPGEDLNRSDRSQLSSSYRPDPGDAGNDGITIVFL